MGKYIAYTDGFFDMNTQVGSSACVILDKYASHALYEKAKARQCTLNPEKKQRNNEQELGAIIMAVRSVPNGSELRIFSDSQYAVNVLSGNWEAKANLDLIERYHLEVRQRALKVEIFWVRGHDTSKWNNYADELCEKVVRQFMDGGPNIIENGNQII